MSKTYFFIIPSLLIKVFRFLSFETIQKGLARLISDLCTWKVFALKLKNGKYFDNDVAGKFVLHFLINPSVTKYCLDIA